MIQQVVDINQDDLLLVAGVREGKIEAFSTLYARYKQPVYLYCVRMLGDRDGAEDVFQDIFVRSYELMRDGKEFRNLKSYLFTSARNRCLNVIRDRKRTFEPEEIPDDETPSVEALFDGVEGIHDALQRLPELNREAFLLCEYEGYSYEEVAELTGVPVTTVRKRIFRARQKLRAFLSREDF